MIDSNRKNNTATVDQHYSQYDDECINVKMNEPNPNFPSYDDGCNIDNNNDDDDYYYIDQHWKLEQKLRQFPHVQHHHHSNHLMVCQQKHRNLNLLCGQKILKIERKAMVFF